MKNPILAAERLREVLNYDAKTGVFTWKVSLGRRVHVSDFAGNPHSKGYVRIKIYGKRYLAHRLAWLYVKGVWPEHDLDHIDLNKANNRIENLRKATRSQNQHNRRAQSNNKSGAKGVCWHKRAGKYRATIHSKGKQNYLGLFTTIAAASDAYAAAAREHHGEFARIK